MGIYDYLNTNNNQIADLSYNAEAKALIDNLIAGNIDDRTSYGRLGKVNHMINGYQTLSSSDNQYRIKVPDPQSSGYFWVNAQIDPNTGKATNLGSTYGSNGNDYSSFYAPLAVAAMIAAPALAPELMGYLGGAEAGSTVAGDAFLPGALATDATVAPTIAADVATQVAPTVAADVAATAPSLSQIGSSALTGAGKGLATTVARDVLTGQPITPEGLLTGAVTGGVGGGVGNLAGQLDAGTIGSGIAAGTAGGATGAALNGGNIGQGALSGALSGLSSGITGDTLKGLDPVTTAAGQSVASTLTNALKTGNTNNLVENLISGGLSSAGLTGLINGLPDTPTAKTDVASTGGLSEAELAAINNPYDTTQYPNYAPVASTGTDTPLVPLSPTVSIGNLTDNQSSPQGALLGTNGVENPDGTVTMPDGTVNTYDANGELVSSMPPTAPSVDTTNINFIPQQPATTPQVSAPTPDTQSPLSTVTPQQPTASVTQQQPPIDLSPINSQLGGLNTGLNDLSGTVSGLGTGLNNLSGTVSGLGTGLNNLSGTVSGLGTGLNNLSGTVSGLGTGLDTANQNITNLGNTVTQNQATTDKALTNLSDAQKAQIASQTAMGVSLNSAINNVQSNVSGQVNNLKSTIADMSETAPKATLLKGTQVASPLASVYNLPIEPYVQPVQNPQSLYEIQNAAEGGIIHKASGGSLPMVPKLLKGQSTQHPNLMGWHGAQLFADGGMAYQDRTLPEGHNPKFFSEGGLSSMENRYVTGDGDGTSDSIPAMLANGEFVIPADIVSGLGNGSNDAGAEILNAFMETIREHKQKHDAKNLPPNSLGPLAYLKQAKQKASA